MNISHEHGLKFASTEDLVKRLSLAESAMELAREFAGEFVDGAPDASRTSKFANSVVHECSIALGHIRTMV